MIDISRTQDEEVGDGTTFLFGLDLQRMMNTWADSLNGQIYMRVTDHKTGEVRDENLETAQCRGSGLLLFRVDNFYECWNKYKNFHTKFFNKSKAAQECERGQHAIAVCLN